MEPTAASLGLGTYLGGESSTVDASYSEAARTFHALGGKVFDTAANYRKGRSERALGTAFAGLQRDEFFVSTKAGYLPMGDPDHEESARAWFERALLQPGILSAEDVTDGCHAMTPLYLDHQLEISRAALGVSCVDLFHLHNPEQQRPQLGPARFEETLMRAFEACERFVSEGRIKSYGVATWNGFRVEPHRPDHLSLERLLALAVQVGGPFHHFRWVQLPLNLALPEALLAPTQHFDGKRMSFLHAAQIAGIHVQTSASMMQARILDQLKAQWDELSPTFPGCNTPAQMALQFTRSCPGVTVALCGMGHVDHVRENTAVMSLPPVAFEALQALFR